VVPAPPPPYSRTLTPPVYFEQFEKVLSTGVTRYGLEVFTTVYIYASRYCRGKFEEEVVALLRKIVNNES